MRYACIHRRRDQLSVRMMCRLLKVSRSGYYDWRHREASARTITDRHLMPLIRQVHMESRGVYGARKVHRELLANGHACGRHKVARLMRRAGLKGCPRRRFRHIEDRPPSYPRAHNLLQQDFTAPRSDQRWASDITYIATRQGWLYLAVVMDLYSRRIVGWSMDRRTGRQLVVAAMKMALGQREPPRLHHSDRGPQYASDDFRELLQNYGITCSMSGRGSCYDNAPVESFFSLLKRERIRRQTYPTREAARADIFDYIERFYNRKRIHATLGYLSPAAFEEQAMRA